MNFFEFIVDWVNENPGKTVGALAGLIFGILILTAGFFKTLFIIILILIGFIIGKLKDDKISVIDEFKRIFRRDRDE